MILYLYFATIEDTVTKKSYAAQIAARDGKEARATAKSYLSCCERLVSITKVTGIYDEIWVGLRSEVGE